MPGGEFARPRPPDDPELCDRQVVVLGDHPPAPPAASIRGVPPPRPALANDGRFTLYTTSSRGPGGSEWAYLWTYEGQRPDWGQIRDDHGPGRYRLVDELGAEATEQIAPLSEVAARRRGSRRTDPEADVTIAEAIERALRPVVQTLAPVLADQRRAADQQRQAIERLAERVDRLPELLRPAPTMAPVAPRGPSMMEEMALKLFERMADHMFAGPEQEPQDDAWLKDFVVGVAGKLMGGGIQPAGLPQPRLKPDAKADPAPPGLPPLDGMTEDIARELEALAAKHDDYNLADVIEFGRAQGWSAPKLLAQIKRALAARMTTGEDDAAPDES